MNIYTYADMHECWENLHKWVILAKKLCMFILAAKTMFGSSS